jgi:predicted dehydrogenase
MLRVAVIGMGGIGRTHARCYRNDPLAGLVAVCDIVKEKADAAAAEFGVKAYYSVKDLLAHEQLDSVSVTTAGVENGSFHYEPTMQALEAGVHVLCEKPLSNNIGHAREMVAAARTRGRYLATNLNHRFTPAAARAKEWVDQGRLGQLMFINMALWIRNPNESAPYFHIRALHPHSIDVMRYYCGDIKSVQAFFSKGPGRNIWSNASINMLFQNGIIGHLTGSYDMSNNHSIERCEVAGNKGRFVIDNVCAELGLYPHDSREATIIRHAGGMTEFAQTFPARIHRYLEQVSQHVPPEQLDGSGADGLAAQEVIEAAIWSHETRSIVDVGRTA